MSTVKDLREAEKARLRDTLLRARREERVPPKLRRALLSMAATPPALPATEATAGSSAATPRPSFMAWKLAGVTILGAFAVATFDAAPAPPSEPAVRPDETVPAAREEAPRRAQEDAPPVELSTESPRLAPVELPSRSVDDLPTARRNVAAPSKVADANAQRKPVRAAAPPATMTPASTDMRIAEQIRIVEASRAAIHAGRPLEALDWLDRYDTEFPSGALGEEVLVLRIETFVRLGRHREATERAKRFLESRPKSPYAARVRDSISAAGAESNTAR